MPYKYEIRDTVPFANGDKVLPVPVDYSVLVFDVQGKFFKNYEPEGDIKQRVKELASEGFLPADDISEKIVPLEDEQLASSFVNAQRLPLRFIGQNAGFDALFELFKRHDVGYRHVIADIGTGTGEKFAYLCKRVKHGNAMAFDAQPRLPSTASLDIECQELPVPADFISCIDILGILALPIAGMHNAARSLNKNGLLFIADRNLKNSYIAREHSSLELEIVDQFELSVPVLEQKESIKDFLDNDYDEVRRLIAQQGIQITKEEYDQAAKILSQQPEKTILEHTLTYWCTLARKL